MLLQAAPVCLSPGSTYTQTLGAGDNVLKEIEAKVQKERLDLLQATEEQVIVAEAAAKSEAASTSLLAEVSSVKFQSPLVLPDAAPLLSKTHFVLSCAAWRRC